ncbi:SAM-dependent methyltransferase [Streptomyces sp. F63]|uniref:SAM-dependent methyltransferase n=1 Tax=Streptomyces sp. F63 TaxID=2824887 RepID=UPI001B36C619|nr:SAM-dependent methyltransferase [Streptomyces sp. F63]MBQ0986403.1 SAM-dependent methyltransferase [Streptomyces sp. F63]
MADAEEWMRTGPRPPVELRTDRPHAARVYDVLLGGKTNYPEDRKAAEQLLETMPVAGLVAHQNRAFMHRAVRHLAGEAGIRQFLDIGTGIPTPPNLHEVAQHTDPSCRVVYTDNDPIVLAHSRALHESTPEGRTAYIEADLCDPDGILEHPRLRATLDLGKPVAVTLVAVLHWLPQHADPYGIVARLLRDLPAGSHLVLSHATNDFEPATLKKVSDNFRAKGSNVTPRSKDEVLRFFDGLELVEPGLTVVQRWRPDPAEVGAEALSDTDIPLYVGVARKP